MTALSFRFRASEAAQGHARIEWLIALVAAVIAAGVSGGLLYPLGAWEADSALPWPLFAGAIVLAELADIRVVIRSVPVSVRLAEIPIALGLFYLAPFNLVLAAGIGWAIAGLVRRDQPAHRAAAKLATHALGCAGAIVVFRAVNERLPDGLAGDSVSAVAGVAVTVVVLTSVEMLFRAHARRTSLSEAARVLMLGLATAAVNTSLAMVVMSDSIYDAGALMLLIIPALAGVWGYRAFSVEQHRQARLRFLYDCAQLLDNTVLGEEVLGELVVRVRQMLQVRLAEVVVGSRNGVVRRVRADQGSPAYSVTSEEGAILSERRAILGPKAVARILRRGEAELPSDWHSAIVVPLRSGVDIAGTLAVADPHDIARRFRDEDLQLLETVTDRLGLVVQNADLIARLGASLDDVSKLAAIVQSSGEGIIALDGEGRIASWNPGAERLLGIAADEILGQSAAVFADDADVATLREHFALAMSGSQIGEVRMDLRHRAGSRVPVSLTLSPIRTAAGEVVGASAILRDAGDRVRAEQAAAAGAAQLRTVIQASPLGMGVCGPDHRWKEANPALCALLGLPLEALLGRPVTEMVHPDDIATVDRIEQGMFDRGPEARAAERRYVSQDGRVVWARVATRLIPDSPSGTHVVLYTIDDITERRRMEDEARSTEEQFRRATLAISGMQDPARIVRATLAAAREMLHAQYAAVVTRPEDPDAPAQVQTVGIDSEVLVRLLGSWPADTGPLALAGRLGRPVRVRDVRTHPEFGPAPEGASAVTSLLSVPLTHDQPSPSTLIVMNRLGADEFTPGDEAVGVALATHAAVCLENARANERARKLVVELDQTNLELTRANEAKSRFLASVAHELRTPLHAILVAGELVGDPPSGSLRDDEVRRLGRTIESSGRHMVHLIDDLVDLARIEAGRVDLQPTKMDVGEVLGDIATSLSAAAQEKGVVLDLPTKRGQSVVADPVRLRQILINLIANAIKFTERGGRVWAETSASRSSVRISVHDTGIGIARADLERIFEPFEQASRTSRDGAGLGLAIAQSLADLHGGRVEVSSTPGSGSVFTLSVPRLPAPRERPAASPLVREQASLDGRGRSVLVVEDDGTALGLMTDVLRMADYRVWQATSVHDAGLVLDREYPDLVLLDVRLADGSGLDLLPRLRARAGSRRRLPVLALSADTAPEDVRRAMAAGCDAFMPKPVGPRMLLARIRAMMDDSEAVSSRRDAAEA